MNKLYRPREAAPLLGIGRDKLYNLPAGCKRSSGLRR